MNPHTIDMLKLIGRGTYLIFLILGIYFIYQGEVIPKYELKRTSFTEHIENATELPTILTQVIYRDNNSWTYGKDFNISYGNMELTTQTSSHTLAIGENIVNNGSLYLNFEHLHQLQGFISNGVFFSMFRITPINFPYKPELTNQLIWTLNDTGELQSRVIAFSVSFSTYNNSVLCINSQMKCVEGHYDGEVTEIMIKPSEIYFPTIFPEKYTYLKGISGCRTEPYNQLVLKESLKQMASVCFYPCRPSITFGQELDKIIRHLPLCRNDSETSCFDQTMFEVGQTVTREPCTKLEYRVEGVTYPEVMKANMAGFFTKFNTLKVSVKEQYLIYDTVALISSIGGTLGLCIGFSFYDTINTLLSYVRMGTDWIKARR